MGEPDLPEIEVMRYMKLLLPGFLILVGQGHDLAVGATVEDQRVLRFSDAQVDAEASNFAQAIAASTPLQIDGATRLIGAFYLARTKTFFYRYSTDSTLEVGRFSSYVVNHTCSNAVRAAFMTRGLVFRHEYQTPAGEIVVNVRRRDCP